MRYFKNHFKKLEIFHYFFLCLHFPNALWYGVTRFFTYTHTHRKKNDSIALSWKLKYYTFNWVCNYPLSLHSLSLKLRSSARGMCSSAAAAEVIIQSRDISFVILLHVCMWCNMFLLLSRHHSLAVHRHRRRPRYSIHVGI